MAHWSFTCVTEKRDGKPTRLLSYAGAKVEYLGPVYVSINPRLKATNIGKLLDEGRQKIIVPFDTEGSKPPPVLGWEPVVVMCEAGMRQAALIRLPVSAICVLGQLAVISFDHLIDRPPKNGEL
jgi:hypothetical protein